MNEKPKFISLRRFATFITWLKNTLSGKVDKVNGKDLSTNDFTDEYKDKLDSVESSAEVNTIEAISVNGVTQTIDQNKKVDLTIPKNIMDGSAVGSIKSIGSETEEPMGIGMYATQLGYKNKVSSNYGSALGASNVVTGNGGTAIGTQNEVTGNFAISIGSDNVASGFLSVANGSQNKATGNYSHATGIGTTAASENQTVIGAYNIADNNGTYVEIVGNGSYNRKSNARTLDWNGNETLAGKLTVGANPTTSMDVATKGYVDEGLANIDLTDYATKAEIPTKLSDLTNDSDYTNKTYVDAELVKKQDTLSFATPTLENVGKALMAKTISGGKVTEWEFGEAGKVDDVQVNGISVLSDKVASITVPTNNNQLINGAGYQTASDVNATIATAIQDLVSTRYYVCETGEYDTTTYVPTLEGELGIIYLVPKPIGVSGYDDDSLVGTAPVGTATIANTINIFYEYIYTGEKFEQIGDTKVDLTGYLTDADIATNSDVSTMLNQVFS